MIFPSRHHRLFLHVPIQNGIHTIKKVVLNVDWISVSSVKQSKSAGRVKISQEKLFNIKYTITFMCEE